MTRVTDLNCILRDSCLPVYECSVETDDRGVIDYLMNVDRTLSTRYRFNYNENVLPKIKKVIFNPPATIVLWADRTKTVVKQQPCDMAIDDEDNLSYDNFNKEIGLAMAICKKAMGNKGNFNNVFNKWIWDKEN